MPDTIHDRIHAYSTRAQEALNEETISSRPRSGACLTAAAGATLALASGADADIIYSGPQNLLLAGGDTYVATGVNLDGVGPIDFRFRLENFSTTSGSRFFRAQTLRASADTASNRILATLGLKLFTGESLIPGGSGPLSSSAGDLATRNRSSNTQTGAIYTNRIYGQWAGVISGPGYAFQRGFLGVQLGTGPDVNYGWIQVEVVSDPDGFITDATIIDWAYETNVNTPIAAGAIPEANSLALLAAGAAGLAALRRFRKNAKAPDGE